MNSLYNPIGTFIDQVLDWRMKNFDAAYKTGAPEDFERVLSALEDEVKELREAHAQGENWREEAADVIIQTIGYISERQGNVMAILKAKLAILETRDYRKWPSGGRSPEQRAAEKLAKGGGFRMDDLKTVVDQMIRAVSGRDRAILHQDNIQILQAIEDQLEHNLMRQRTLEALDVGVDDFIYGIYPSSISCSGWRCPHDRSRLYTYELHGVDAPYNEFRCSMPNCGYVVDPWGHGRMK